MLVDAVGEEGELLRKLLEDADVLDEDFLLHLVLLVRLGEALIQGHDDFPQLAHLGARTHM